MQIDILSIVKLWITLSVVHFFVNHLVELCARCCYILSCWCWSEVRFTSFMCLDVTITTFRHSWSPCWIIIVTYSCLSHVDMILPYDVFVHNFFNKFLKFCLDKSKIWATLYYEYIAKTNNIMTKIPLCYRLFLLLINQYSKPIYYNAHIC